MVFLKNIKKSLQRRKIIRILALLLRKIAEEKTAPQAMLHIFLETRDPILEKNTFKKLKKLFSRLSFIDIYSALGQRKIKDYFKEDFWEMTLKFGLDNAELCAIIRSSDFFFAKKAFEELLERFKKHRISKDRIKSFLVDIMIYRPEFASDGWLMLKKLGPSLDDLVSIKDGKPENYRSDFYNPIREEFEKTLDSLDKDHDKMLRRVRSVERLLIKIKDLN